MFRGKWLWALMIFILLTLLIGTGVTVITYRRASSLGELRLQADKTLQSMYLLTNSTNVLMYNSNDIFEAQIAWNESFSDAFTLLDSLSAHPGLSYLDPSISQNVRQTRTLWNITTNGFVSGDKNLTKFLESDIELEEKNNIRTMLDEVILAGSEGRFSEEDSGLAFLLRQASLEIDSTNDQLWFFTSSALEALGNEIQDESDRVIRLIINIAGIIMVLLLALILAALFTSLRILRITNLELEKQVADRTTAIQNLLDFSGEGFLSFGPDFIVNPNISRECTDIFGRSIAGDNIAELLFSEEQAKADFKDAVTLIFSGTSMPDVVFDVLEPKVKIEGKIIELGFHLVDKSTIMCQLTDITETEELQKTLESENIQREMILRIVTSKRYFLSLLEEAKNLFAAFESYIDEGNYCADDEENENIIRALHTFKANAAFLKMSQTESLAHNLESTLIEYGILSDAEPLGPEINEFRTAFNNEVETVSRVLGKDWKKSSDNVEASIVELQKTREYILNKYPEDNELISLIDSFSFLPLSDLFSRVSELADHLAITNGKRVKVDADVDDILITPELYSRLSDSSNHILRNMITHGIEFPGHREKAGKPREGKISIKAVESDGNVQIKLSDDGAGLSLKKIRTRAVEIGRLNENDRDIKQGDLVKMIFEPGFSTADTITAVSGRGFGLSAVRESIYEIGGKINITSARGRGTGFIITVPNRRKDIDES